MDRLDAMKLFVTAAEAGSLAAAARRHGRSPAAVTRAVALLERFAGETLLLRSTRKISLTSAGEHHLTVWREVLEKLDDGVRADGARPLDGRIVLTAPELFGRLCVMPLVETFLARNPRVETRVLLVNRIVNLIGEGIDVAARLAPLPDSALTAIRIGQIRTLLCASPAYVAARGVPATLQDLDRHDCIGLNAEGDAELWPFALSGSAEGRVRSVRVRTRLSVNNAAAAIDAARRGGGIVAARSYQVADDLASGRLIRVLDVVEAPPTPVHIVLPAGRAKNGTVRAFIDHAAPALKRQLTAVEAVLSSEAAAKPCGRPESS